MSIMRQMGTGILSLLAIAAAFLIFCLNRGQKMREDKRMWPELFWYVGGIIPLIIVSVVWTAMENQAVPQRILLVALGMALGGIGFYALGEYLRPTAAQSSQLPGSVPSVTPQQDTPPAVVPKQAEAAPTGKTFLDGEDLGTVTILDSYVGGADTVFKLKRVEGVAVNRSTIDQKPDHIGKIPGPPPELASLSKEQLKALIHKFCQEIREFRAGFDRRRDVSHAKFNSAIGNLDRSDHAKSKAKWIAADAEQRREIDSLDKQEREEFTQKYLTSAIALAGAVISKTGQYMLPDGSNSLVRQGLIIISNQKLVGPDVEPVLNWRIPKSIAA